MNKTLSYLVGLLTVVVALGLAPGSANAEVCPNGYTICNDSGCILYNIAVVWIPLEATVYGGILVPGKCITFTCPPGKTGIFGISVNNQSYTPGTHPWADPNCTAASIVVVGNCSAIID